MGHTIAAPEYLHMVSRTMSEVTLAGCVLRQRHVDTDSLTNSIYVYHMNNSCTNSGCFLMPCRHHQQAACYIVGWMYAGREVEVCAGVCCLL